MNPHRPRKVPLEVAVFSIEDALRAQTLGASRIELNATGSYAVGGLTPTVQQLQQLRAEPRRQGSIAASSVAVLGRLERVPMARRIAAASGEFLVAAWVTSGDRTVLSTISPVSRVIIRSPTW